MTTPAELYAHRFDGEDVAGVVNPWPGFEFPLVKGTPEDLTNPQSGAQSGVGDVPLLPVVNEPFIPTIDGAGHGMGPRGFDAFAYRWVLRSGYRPGRAGYQAELWARFRRPGATVRTQGAGCLFRLVDNGNHYSARLSAPSAMGTPVLGLYKVVAGAATLLDSYTGTDVSAADLANGVRWRVAVEDLPDGTTQIRVYTRGPGSTGRGTQRISWTGTVPELRGSHGTGVELVGGVTEDDVLVDDHVAYDLSDAGGEASGSGGPWIVEVDGVAYTRAELRGLLPGIQDVRVTQSIGVDGCSCEIDVAGDAALGSALRWGRRIRVLHAGAVRFEGRLVGVKTTAGPRESQTWTAVDELWGANQVNVAEDDGSSTLYFNVPDETSDQYRDDRQNMTDGQIVAFLFDRYETQLRFFGAVPASGPMVDPDDLEAMSAVIPGRAVSGSFLSAIAQLVDATLRRQPFRDPATGIWRMRDLVGARAVTVRARAEWVRATVTSDARRVTSAIRFVGARKERSETTLRRNVPGESTTLEPLWTAAQAANDDGSKQARRTLDGKIAGFGVEDFRGIPRAFLLVSASYGLTEDEWRGAFETGATDAFVVGNTATKIYVARGSIDDLELEVGDPFRLTLLDARAQWQLSQMGVGRSYRILAPITICGVAGAGLYEQNVGANRCGVARVGTKGSDGSTSYESIEVSAYAATAEAAAAGYCDPSVVLAKPPTLTLGLVNYLGPAPGGSPPTDQCKPTAALDSTSLEVDVQTLEDLPMVRVPETEGTYQGAAFDAWGTIAAIERVVQIPDFVDQEAQEDGLREAGEQLLAITGEIPLLFEAEISTPWDAHPAFPQHPDGYPTSQWAGLEARVVLTSEGRTLGTEDLELYVYSVTWSLFGETTRLVAGTAAGWLDVAFEAFARAFVGKGEASKMVQTLAAARELIVCLNGGPPDKVGAQPVGPIPGCKVEIVDSVRATVENVERDDEKKKSGIQHVRIAGDVAAAVSGLAPVAFPGKPPTMPGYDGDAALQFTEAGGAIPRPLPASWLPGPLDVPGGQRGRYGSPVVTDPTLAGRPPDLIGTFRRYALRKAPDATGDSAGGEVAQVSAIDRQGEPTGGWSDLVSLLQLGEAGPPLGDAVRGSYPAQLAARDRAVFVRAGFVTDAAGRVLAPGTVTAEYPDGVPADRITAAAAAAVARDLRVEPGSLSDPGGVVWRGPIGPDGVDAGFYWRVLPPGRSLVLVEPVTPGSGTNGGAWADVVDADDAYTLLVGGGIVHKQIDAASLRSEGVGGGVVDVAAPAAEDDSPFCFVGGAGRILSGGAVVSGAGGKLSLPPHAVGTIAVVAHVKERLTDAPELSGNVAELRLAYAVQGSPWDTATETATQEAPETDGAGTGTAAPVFLVPGGAVPPGLRKPTDLALSIRRDGSAGTAAGDVVLTGLGVDVAVVERSPMQRAGAGLGVSAELAGSVGVARAAAGLGATLVSHRTSVLEAGVGIRGGLRSIDPGSATLFAALGVSATVARGSAEDEIPAALGLRARATWRVG